MCVTAPRLGSGRVPSIGQAVRRGLDGVHYDGPLIHNPIITSEVATTVHESNLIRSLLIEESLPS